MKEWFARRPDTPALTIWLGLAFVLAIGGIASYGQALIVVQATDGPTHISYFVAGLADPTAFVASVNVLDARQRDKEWAWWSVGQVVIALAITLYANVMSGHPHDVPPWAVRAWPAIAVGMTLHSLFDFRRRRAVRRAQCRDMPEEREARPLSTDDALRLLLGTGSRRGLAEDLQIPRTRVDQWHVRVKPREPGTSVAAELQHLNGSAE